MNLDKYTAYALFTGMFVLFWNVLDYVYSVVITKVGYHFTSGTDLFYPLLAALVLGYLLFMRKK